MLELAAGSQLSAFRVRRYWHQRYCPLGWSAPDMPPVPGTEIDRGGLATAAVAAHGGQCRLERPVSALHQQPYREENDALAAMQLQGAIRPVGQSMLRTEGRWMHPCQLARTRQNAT